MSGVSIAVTLDSGASTSCIDAALAARTGVPVRALSSTATVPGAHNITFVGVADVSLVFGGVTLDVSLHVLHSLGHDVLLGSPVLWPANGVGRLLIDAPPAGAPVTSCMVTLAGSRPVLAHTTPLASQMVFEAVAAIAATPTDDIEMYEGTCHVGDQPFRFEIHGSALTRLVDAVPVLDVPVAPPMSSTVCRAFSPPSTSRPISMASSRYPSAMHRYLLRQVRVRRGRRFPTVSTYTSAQV